MHRLLQGEVGSGKTVVALAALLMGVQGGYQGAFMAPTEVLAEQHELTMRRLLDGLAVPEAGSLLGDRPVGVALLTNRTGAAERRRIAEGLAHGTVDILVGTHALLYEGVEFARLGVVVIDEQHRFGVEQRDLLRGKARRASDTAAPGIPVPSERASGDARGALEPDVLVMTATPIPRTAAMLIYGDLDRSELRELPAGRSPITTEVVGPSPLERVAVYDRVRGEVAAGRQAYVVCPLVEGSERTQAKAATEEFERLGGEELAGLRLGLLHGQLPSAEKEAVMQAFRGGDLDVLVATTVIEVGIDVPNATVMVVEDADRFGLLQLHQLRGRIGRGNHASWCYLLADPATPEGRARSRGDARAAATASTSRSVTSRSAARARSSASASRGSAISSWVGCHATRRSWSRPVPSPSRSSTTTATWPRTQSLREEVEDLLGDAVDFLFKS